MKNRNLDHKDDWRTPQQFYETLNSEFLFDFDPCPFQHNIEEWDGLNIEWGKSNFCNPPYSRQLKEAFIRKGFEESQKGKLVVFLLPVSTSTKIFHEVILPNKKEIRFVKGRVKFCGWNSEGQWVDNKPGQHDSMLVIFGEKK